MQVIIRSILKWGIRLLLKPVLSSRVPIKLQRFWSRVIVASSLPPRGMRKSETTMEGVPGEKLTIGTHGSRALLYLHGGGYCIGSPATHRTLAAHVARAAQAVAYVPAYRLAPEYPHPAAVNDALASYRYVLAQGYDARQVIVAGDSAGGGLALALALAVRDAGIPAPAALLLISPWTDLTLSGDTARTHARRDPMLSPDIGQLWSRLYLGTHAANEPLCSPLFANLAGLPPMLIQVGSEEILLADSTRLARAALAAGVAVELHEYPRMWHEFQIHAGALREADEALTEMREFVKRRLP